MKRPTRWPSELVIKRISPADRFGTGGTYAVFRGGAKVAIFYRSSRGWAYASEEFGSHGAGYSGEPTLYEALHHFAFRYATSALTRLIKTAV